MRIAARGVSFMSDRTTYAASTHSSTATLLTARRILPVLLDRFTLRPPFPQRDLHLDMLTEPVVNEPDISIVRLDIDAVTRDAHIERATAAHAAWIIAVFPFVDHLAALVFQPQRMQQPRIDHAAGNTVKGCQLYFCTLGTAGDRINAHDIIADGNARARRLRVPTLPASPGFCTSYRSQIAP